MANRAIPRGSKLQATTSPAGDHYLSKKAACIDATNNVETLIRGLRRLAIPLLADWSKCYIALPGAAMPRDMAKARKPIAGDTVPSVEQLQRALVRQYEAQHEATHAWNVLSRQEQKKVGRPPWLKR